jgi:hypothetical protein
MHLNKHQEKVWSVIFRIEIRVCTLVRCYEKLRFLDQSQYVESFIEISLVL